jgi:hypothetical protein
MRTAELIAALAADAPKVRPTPVMRRMLAACTIGALVAAVALAIWLGLRPLGEALVTRAFWMKTGYTLALGLAGLLLVGRLARPGARIGRIPLIALAAVVAMGILSVMEMSRTPPGHMRAVWMGHTASVCSLRILALAIPVYLGSVWALRRLAPTRLALAGAAAGLLAGGVGATVYGLYCAETAATFVVTWYTLGVAACAGLGAVAGARLLRW